MILARRSFLVGAAASLLTAPAIVRAASLMPVKAMPLIIGRDWPWKARPTYLHVSEEFMALFTAELQLRNDPYLAAQILARNAPDVVVI